MKRAATSILAIAMLSVLVGAASATHLPTTGTAIRLLYPAQTPATFAADTPFFVRHGWTCLPEERSVCLDPTSGFRLYVDGERMRSALDLHLSIACPPEAAPVTDGCTNKGNLTNFRFGLPAGSHAFRGEWWASGELVIVREATIEFVG